MKATKAIRTDQYAGNQIRGDVGQLETLENTGHQHTCQQCDDHPCYEACPKKDKAMLIDENGIVYVNEEECVGCGLCAKACPQNPSMITIVKDKSLGKRRAIKCDLCRTRPEGPACVEYCQAMCLGVKGDEPWNK